ncbi:hypothetical protein AVEN_267792-1, partial [Araneus ventricosus]
QTNMSDVSPGWPKTCKKEPDKSQNAAAFEIDTQNMGSYRKRTMDIASLKGCRSKTLHSEMHLIVRWINIHKESTTTLGFW